MVRRLIRSRTAALTVIGGSRPRGVGFQAGFALEGVGVGFLIEIVVVLLFLIDTGEGVGIGGAIDVTPAQVEGASVAGKRSTSFSERNISLSVRIWSPVAASSRTMGGPSIIVILVRSSFVITSSRNGAYPASWEIPRRICLQLWFRRCHRIHSIEVSPRFHGCGCR